MKLISFGALCFVFLFGVVTVASLGDGEDSVATDVKTFSARSQKTQMSQYQVHELVLPTTIIKEYISASGVVFAVTWQGPKKPDLTVLLGSHYQEYISKFAQREKGGGRRSNTVRTDKLYVHGGGHMRDLRGIAYLPAQLPAGINVESLQ